MFASLITGCLIRYSATLRRMFSVSRSASNLAEWTPMTTSSFLYFSSSFARSGRTWWQLMQQNVQKSSRTILPRSSASAIGPELIQPTPPAGWASGSLVVRRQLHVRIRSRSSRSGDAGGRLVDKCAADNDATDDGGNGEQGRRPAGRRAIGTHARDLIVGGRSDRFAGTTGGVNATAEAL